MRVVARRRLVLGHLSGFGIELANRSVAVPGVPDDAVAIDEQSVRAGAARHIPFGELLGLSVEARNHVGVHDGDVDVAVRPGRRIAREVRRRHRPLADLARDLRQRAGNDAIATAARGRRDGKRRSHECNSAKESDSCQQKHKTSCAQRVHSFLVGSLSTRIRYGASASSTALKRSRRAEFHLGERRALRGKSL